MKRTLCLSTLLGVIAAQSALDVGSDLCTREQLLTLDTFSVKASVLDNFCLANSDFLSDECFCDQENYDRTRKQVVWSRTCYNDTDSLEYLADYEAFIIGLCQEYSPAVVNNTFTLPDNLSYSETSSCNSSIAQYTAAIDNYFDCQYQYDNTTNDSSEEVVECYCRNAQGVIDALDNVNSDCDDDSVDNSARSLYDTFVRTDCTGLTLRGTTFSVSLPTTTRTTTRRSTTARTPTARTITARTATTGAATTGATPTTAADATQAATTVAPTAAPVTTQASSGAHPLVSEYGSPLLVQIAILALIVTAFVL